MRSGTPTAPATQAFVDELRAETETTRRLLDRIPADRLTWRPHPKSMTIGQLGLHIASIPGDLCNLASMDGFDASQANFEPAQPASAAAISEALAAAVVRGAEYLGALEDAELGAVWNLTSRGKPVFSVPRAGLLRSILFNHWYHHRGQLSVYLRLLDVPVPVSYGRTADEDPFAA